MTPFFSALLLWRASSCTRLLRFARDAAPASASTQIESGQLLRARFMVTLTTRSSELLDEAMKGDIQHNEFVKFNLKRVISTREKIKALHIEKSGPDARGYLTYTVTYQLTIPEVTSLFYTVKEGSREASLLSDETFQQDSLLDIFPKRLKNEFTIVKVKKDYTCWPRGETKNDAGFRFRLCTHEIQFKNPELARADVRAIDVIKKYTNEHESKYKGTYFQINGEDALDQNELTPLQSGVISAVCYVNFVGGASSAGEVASQFAKTDREVIANIFGGSPSHYIPLLQGVGCNDDNTCALEILWGEATDPSIHKFAIKKSVERANEDLTNLTQIIFGNKWKITKITNKIKEKKENKKKNSPTRKNQDKKRRKNRRQKHDNSLTGKIQSVHVLPSRPLVASRDV